MSVIFAQFYSLEDSVSQTQKNEIKKKWYIFKKKQISLASFK